MGRSTKGAWGLGNSFCRIAKNSDWISAGRKPVEESLSLLSETACVKIKWRISVVRSVISLPPPSVNKQNYEYVINSSFKLLQITFRCKIVI